ncbi:hypothetical protein PIROE2DRAFT_12091 [Piromyces sp. E2]|nr:hypothetical protein PIROE2DRAFT_12091 [Piromyces sp. E2]|eukprot:OUM61788.1 hypothetical protein PIROE2DRAFT_12091 [Piromyces sp. E2]
MDYINLENNIGLTGKIPTLDFNSNKLECNYGGTNLCYSTENINPSCIYPQIHYNCSDCKDSNSVIVDGVCQCQSGYSGIGYMECFENECSNINSFLGENTTYDCCNRRGIICSRGRIVEINLHNENLIGKIPDSISNLSELEKLNLSKNKLSGEIPTKELEKLKKLCQIHLEDNNDLYGRIPSIEYINNELCKVECNFSGTQLCYSKMNGNPLCVYPETYYDCLNCKGNSYIEENVCKCRDNYEGIGYIECYEKQENEEEEIDDLNQNDCEIINQLIGKPKDYDCCKEEEITCLDGRITDM